MSSPHSISIVRVSDFDRYEQMKDMRSKYSLFGMKPEFIRHETRVHSGENSSSFGRKPEFGRGKTVVRSGVFCCLLGGMLLSCEPSSKTVENTSAVREKTAFQTSSPWKPQLQVDADVAIVYGTQTQKHLSFDGKLVTFEERVKSWQDHGYTTHFMTGSAWGEYQDYFTGEWDGKTHLDEGQVTREGDTIWHGPMVPYIVPSANFIRYMQEKQLKRVIDAGIDAIYLEEPEFWARGGYSDAFKREWKAFYGTEWRPQHESAENTYLANKLKYHLYYRALNEMFSYAKSYGETKGMKVRCYVPTHSLVNYSQWQIVSPEASLASLPCVDGYIAQVWTGTSRVPNYYNGVEKERVFENAFLEYGCMVSMTAPTGRKMYFLTDPIEDRPRDWADYRQNYEATFMAKLLYAGNDNYEVMPWPERIYEGLYKKSADSDEMIHIPRFYSTQMQVMIHALNDMPLSANSLSGSKGISVLMANSLMFQRTPEPVAGYDDPLFSNFYGQVLPFLKRGVPVHLMHIENVSYEENWKDTKLLLMSYTNMKPLEPEAHRYIADWVKKGGVLVYTSTDSDSFQQVPEWWNQGGNSYQSPADHLFEQMGLSRGLPAGEYPVGKGMVCVVRQDPKAFVMQPGGDADFVSTVKRLYESKTGAGELQFKNNFYMERGKYDLVAVMDESVSPEPYEVKGQLIDLFDPQLPILTTKRVNPGEQSLLLDLNRVEEKDRPQVLCAATRISDEERTSNSYRFMARGPLNTTNVMHVLLPKEPKKVSLCNAKGEAVGEVKHQWNPQSKTDWITFENDPEGVRLAYEW